MIMKNGWTSNVNDVPAVRSTECWVERNFQSKDLTNLPIELQFPSIILSLSLFSSSILVFVSFLSHHWIITLLIRNNSSVVVLYSICLINENIIFIEIGTYMDWNLLLYFRSWGLQPSRIPLSPLTFSFKRHISSWIADNILMEIVSADSRTGKTGYLSVLSATRDDYIFGVWKVLINMKDEHGAPNNSQASSRFQGKNFVIRSNDLESPIS